MNGSVATLLISAHTGDDCRASKMPVEQAEEARQLAEAGQNLPAADHLANIADSFQASARGKMASAVEGLRTSFERMKKHGQ